VRALDVSRVPEDAAREYTHGFHTYAARMHPLTARRALALALAKKAQHALVVDPFCGSGTVLVEAALCGMQAVGVDANPLCALITRAKLWKAPSSRRRELLSVARRLAARVVEEGKAARRSGYEPPAPRPPPEGVSKAAHQERMRAWFDPHVRRELETLAQGIAAEPDEELRPILLALLSSILIKVSRRASDTSAAQAERHIARGMAARLLAARAEELVVGLTALDRDAGPAYPAPRVRLGDARYLDRSGIASGSVAAVVTSPPYAGTYDYLEQHALRLAFLGLPMDVLAARELGARRYFQGGAAKVKAALAEWERDLGAVLAEVARVLLPSGRAVLLLGDSLAGAPPHGVAVHADDLIRRLAQGAGLWVRACASQRRTALGTAEKAAFAARDKCEHLLLLEHVK
jgi:SAM-dependent methyltransferase